MKKASIVIIIAVLMEVFIFNFENIKLICDSSLEKNIEVLEQEIEFVNWEEVDGKKITLENAYIYIKDVNTYVKKLQIDIKYEGEVPFLITYYTNSKNENINDEHSIATTEVDTINKILLQEQVNDLRIDIGEKKGVKLEDIKVIINPAKMTFNISRVVAIIFIYFSTVLLFAIQKNPEYRVEEEK